MFEEASQKDDYGWNTYQPINVKGYEKTLEQSGRKCQDRANMLIKHIKENFPSHYSFVDWGCNNGYFVFELAKHGYSATGLDREQKYIDICRVVNKTSGYNPSPKFFREELNPLSIEQHAADIALCFSVLHHIKDDKIKIFDQFSKIYKKAYIEMDGGNFGHDYLSVYYWDIQFVCEVNDNYGKGKRLRKTWFCSNETEDAIYSNIKMNNCLGGRSVFLKESIINGQKTVIKRENYNFQHTWIKTDLLYEIEMYKKYSESFLPKYIHSDTIKEKLLEIEYIDEKSDKGAPLDVIFDWLKRNKMYIIDINADQFIKTQNGFVMVDIESIFPYDMVEKYLRKPIKLRSYEEQIEYLEGKLQ